MKNKLIIGLLLLLASTMEVIAQNRDNVHITEPRSSRPYHNIRIVGELNVKIVQEETPGVVVKGTGFQVYNTITVLRNDTLFVFQMNTRKEESKAFVKINVNNIASLEVWGKTKVDCSGLVNTDFLTIRAYDGAQIKIDVRALKVDSKATSNSYINLSGSTIDNVETVDETGKIDSHQLDVIEFDESIPVIFCTVC